MPAPSHVVIAFAKADADQKAASSLALGFRRDGAQIDQVTELREVLDLLHKPADERPDMVVASLNLEGRGDGLELVRAVRRAHDAGVAVERARPPVILVGDGERRGEALAAGASAFVAKPAFVKDIVTLAGILAMARDGLEPGWGGELGALHLYYVVRALGAARRTGVLSLVRGGRRGELRFYDGEVTSAQVGSLHGQAAFHQLLLWPEAHFDLRVEQVVRRQQIPLSPAELLQDAERFLRDFNELAGGLSPSSVYEQDARRAAEHVDEIPKEVTPVLRLFDGTRSVADVIEDSPTRLAETLKIVKRLLALGVLSKLGAPRPVADTAPALLVDDWLVGGGPGISDGRPEPIEPHGGEGSPPRRPRREAPPAAPSSEWGMGGGQTVWEAASYAPVVPSLSKTGEIQIQRPPVTAASSSDMVKKSGTGNGEGVDPPSVRTNGKTQIRAEASSPPAKHKKGKREAATKPLRPVPSASKSGEISVPAVIPVEKDFTSAPPIEVAPDLPAETLPPPELTATAPLRTTPAAPPPHPAAAAHDRFEDHEEEFFRQEEKFLAAEAPSSESFDDLDEGQPKPSFWKRLFKRRS